jgi:hypothetical protein
MVVRDWRYVARLCNIDTGDWPDPGDMLKYLVQLIGRVPNIRMGKPALYMSQSVKDMLDVAAMSKSNVFIQVSEDPFGLPVTKFRGIPLRRVDTILNTETALVSAA